MVSSGAWMSILIWKRDKTELFNTYKENTGLDAYDIQEISPVEYEKLRQNGMEELSGEEYNN